MNFLRLSGFRASPRAYGIVPQIGIAITLVACGPG